MCVRDPFDERFEPVPPEFFYGALQGSIGALCTALDVPEGAPSHEQLDMASKAWSETTRFFRVDGKWLCLSSAIIVTGAMVGKPIAMSVQKKAKAKHGRPAYDPATQEAGTAPEEGEKS